MSAVIIPMQQSTAQQLAAEYVAAGWRLCLIPYGQKSPTVDGWNQPEKAIVNAAQLPEGDINIGLLHAWSKTCSLDIDHLPAARLYLASKGIDLDALLDADDAVQINSGRENSGKLVYSTVKPMPSKKVVAEIDGKTRVILEFRSASASGSSVQCVVPPSRHPEGGTYGWGGKGDWRALPALPETLLAVWEELIEGDKTPRVPITGAHAASTEEIEAAVGYCNPDSDRTPWVHVGMALKLELGDAGFPMWDEWSRKSPKYPGEREMGKQWASFKPVPNPVTVGSIFHQAKLNGWKRPQPDLSRLFKQQPMSVEQLMKERFPAAPPLNLTLLPPVLANYAAEVALSIGCDPIAPALAGIGAICGAVDARSRVRINREWTEPPVLWLLTYGTPADKKTPASEKMLRVLRKLEAEDRDRYEVALLKWKGIEARHAGDMKAYREWQQTPEAAFPNAVPPDVTPLPPEPKPLMLVLNDVTSQGAAKEAIPRPQGLLMHQDEMANWLSRVTDKRSGENQSFYTQSYQADPYALTRVGKGEGSTTVRTENLAISVYGNVQPDVLREAAPAITKDGMRARFIVGVLNTELTEVSGECDLPEFLSWKDAYDNMVRVTHTLPTTEYPLSPAARRVFREWEADVIAHNKMLKRHGYSSFMQGLVGKGQGMAARIALVFHVAECPYGLEISEETMRRAVAFVREFVIPHAVVVDQHTEAASLDKWVIQRLVTLSDKPTVSLFELEYAAQRKQDLKTDKRTMDERLRSAMATAEQAGWVTLTRDDGKSVQWAINPMLAGLFESERHAIRDDVASFRQEIVAKSLQKPGY